MLNLPPRWIALFIALVALPGLSGCKKKAAEAGSPEPEKNKPAVSSASVKSSAPMLGFAAMLPPDTEAYLGALNLPAHLDALKTSTWAREVNAFLDDKTPAPSANQSAMPDAGAALAQLWGRDFFIALGKGGAKAVAGWQELSTLNTELQYVTLMQGSLGGGAADAKKTKPEVMLAQLLGNPELLKRAAALVSQLELPPLMLGIQTDKPDQVLKQLVPDALLNQLKTKGKVSQATIGKEGHFTMLEGTFASLLTDEVKAALLASLPPDNKEAQTTIAKALDEVQKKPFALAYGSTNGYVIVAIGTSRPNIEFVTDPAKSLLSRPELSFVIPYTKQKLVGIAFAQGDVLQALQSTEPMQPIARGLLAGLRSNPMFGQMAKALEPKVKELATLERDLQSRKLTNATGVAWWDKGLHVEMKGGQSPEGLVANKPLKFGTLMDDPNTVVGIAYHGDPELTGKIRKLVEGWSALIQQAAQELVKAGLGGKDGPEIAKWVESDIIPQVVDFYSSSKTLFQKGVGNEHAWVIDLGGKMPPLPFFPQKTNQAPPKMLRLASLDEVTTRSVIAQNWDKMSVSLNKVATAFPMLAGQKLPTPDTRNQPGGLTTYSYVMMPGVDDLAPSASISDQVLMIGTSSSQHGDLATRLIKGKPSTSNTTALWRVNFPAIREAVKIFSTSSAEATNADNMKATIKWLSPLGNMTGRLWIEAGNVRNSINIEVKDVLRYD